MSDALLRPCTAFEGCRLLLSGPLIEVALAVKAAMAWEAADPILTFDDATGRVIDLDLRGSKAEIIARLSQPQPTRADQAPSPQTDAADDADAPKEARGRGRPKLGVIGREVTLLPRQWEWLAVQPGGASVALRKLVDDARRNGGAAQKTRTAQERAYHFMLAMAGNLPHYEDAIRALFANDRPRLEQQITEWPQDIAAHAIRLAYG
ncbi:DUF2239 family protein [Bradyrhizobium sp. SYSU BS000235]|uniref:DUF2239 family protein n=1 Tax=Bradyrhizobium sp. SYSU BS000235 TaxID=3411332 RepID=UPI003C77862E